MPSYNPGDKFTPISPWNPARTHPVSGEVRPHRGGDWGAPKGTPIPSAAAGIVVYNGTLAGYGNTVIVEHNINGQTVHTWYAHMNTPSPLSKGSPVGAGQTVGNVGNTGIGKGDHLHFESKRDQSKYFSNIVGTFSMYTHRTIKITDVR